MGNAPRNSSLQPHAPVPVEFFLTSVEIPLAAGSFARTLNRPVRVLWIFAAKHYPASTYPRLLLSGSIRGKYLSSRQLPARKVGFPQIFPQLLWILLLSLQAAPERLRDFRLDLAFLTRVPGFQHPAKLVKQR